MPGNCNKDIENYIGTLPVSLYQNGLAYFETLPCRELRPYIANYWAILPSFDNETVQENVSMKVLPDGCIDLIFILDDERDECWSQAKARTIIGLRRKVMTKSFGMRANRLGVRFLPGGAFPFLRCSASSLFGICKPLNSIWSDTVVRQLEEQIAAAVSLTQKIHNVEKTLIAVLRESESPSQLVTDALNRIHNEKGRIMIDDLALEAGTSNRNLSRLFQKWVGISPKMLCRVVRFHSALEILLKADGKTFSEIALASGYYDHAHFLNEFKVFYGISPYKARCEIISTVNGRLRNIADFSQ